MMVEAEERGVKKTQRAAIQTMLKSLPIEQVAALLELSVDEVQNILRNDK